LGLGAVDCKVFSFVSEARLLCPACMWISLFLSFYLASARPVAIREVASCADQLKFLGCDDIAKLAAQGASAYVEDLAHGQRLFVVPCTGNDHHAMYVAFWRRGSEIRLLKFDQFDTVTREFRSHHGLLAGHLTEIRSVSVAVSVSVQFEFEPSQKTAPKTQTAPKPKLKPKLTFS